MKINRARRRSAIGLVTRRVFGEIFHYRPLGRCQQFKRCRQNTGLKSRIIGRPKGTAELKGYPKGSGWPDLLGMFSYEADLGGRQPFFFKVVGKPAHGARAVGSDGHQKHRIDAIAFYNTGQISCRKLHLLRLGSPHECVMVTADTLNDPFFSQLPQPIKGQNHV